MWLPSRLALLCSATLALSLSGVRPAAADTIFELWDNDAGAGIEAGGEFDFSFQWSVDGLPVAEQFIELIGVDAFAETGVASDTNDFVDDRDDTITLGYTSSDDPVMLITATLRGGFFDPPQSDVAETIEVLNSTQQTLTLI